MAGSILTSDLPCAESDDDHGVSQMNCKCQSFFSMSKIIGFLIMASTLVTIVSLFFITYGTGVLHQGNTFSSKKYVHKYNLNL